MQSVCMKQKIRAGNVRFTETNRNANNANEGAY